MKTYHCPIHGDQGQYVGIHVRLEAQPGAPLPTSLKRLAGPDGVVERMYCYACWIEKMDTVFEPLALKEAST